MHAFMAAVLLGMARLDSFHADTQPKTPDGKFAQIEQGMGGSEGNAVVATDVGRQAALLKEPLQHSKGKVFPGRGKSFASSTDNGWHDR
jgi:hypothetical protein